MDDDARVVEKRRLELIQARQAEIAQVSKDNRKRIEACDASMREHDELRPKLAANVPEEERVAAQTRLDELKFEMQQRDVERQQALSAFERRSQDYAALIGEYSQASVDDGIGL